MNLIQGLSPFSFIDSHPRRYFRLVTQLKTLTQLCFQPAFHPVKTKSLFRLLTNLPDDGDAAASDDEIRDIYRLRWGVELLWKFLKMHLKLDKLITKNVNGITIQIYISLIAYLILPLVSIPKQWGHTLLDKFRYLQSCMCQKISDVHWFEEIMLC